MFTKEKENYLCKQKYLLFDGQSKNDYHTFTFIFQYKSYTLIFINYLAVIYNLHIIYPYIKTKKNLNDKANNIFVDQLYIAWLK